MPDESQERSSTRESVTVTEDFALRAPIVSTILMKVEPAQSPRGLAFGVREGVRADRRWLLGMTRAVGQRPSTNACLGRSYTRMLWMRVRRKAAYLPG